MLLFSNALDIVKSFPTKSKLYSIPQFLWLGLTYYLMLNTLFYFYNKVLSNPNNPLIKIPEVIHIYNELILSIFKDWMPFTFLLSLALMITGLLVDPIKYIPVTKNSHVKFDGAIGWAIGSWLLIIYLTYHLYMINKLVFLLIFIIIISIMELYEKIIGPWIDRNLGIRFSD